MYYPQQCASHAGGERGLSNGSWRLELHPGRPHILGTSRVKHTQPWQAHIYGNSPLPYPFKYLLPISRTHLQFAKQPLHKLSTGSPSYSIYIPSSWFSVDWVSIVDGIESGPCPSPWVWDCLLLFRKDVSSVQGDTYIYKLYQKCAAFLWGGSCAWTWKSLHIMNREKVAETPIWNEKALSNLTRVCHS